MMKYEMTRHAREERLDRLSQCVECLGLGEILIQKVEPENNRITQVTSTGIILIVGYTSGKLVTGYMGTVAQVAYLFHGHTPTSLYKKVKENNKKYPHLLNIQKIGVDKTPIP